MLRAGQPAGGVCPSAARVDGSRGAPRARPSVGERPVARRQNACAFVGAGRTVASRARNAHTHVKTDAFFAKSQRRLDSVVCTTYPDGTVSNPS